MTRGRAVLLDLYGTLVEPDWPLLTAGRVALAQRVGVAPEKALRAWHATHPARMTGDYGSLEQDLSAVFAQAQEPEPSPFIDASLLAELAGAERANWRRGVAVYPDVLLELGRLRAAGFRLAIVTDASAEAAGVLTELGLDRAVDLTLASCDARCVKPELLDIAVERLGVEPPAAVLVDNDPATVEAACQRGMQAVLIRRGAPSAPQRDAVIGDLRELSALLLGDEPPPPR